MCDTCVVSCLRDAKLPRVVSCDQIYVIIDSHFTWCNSHAVELFTPEWQSVHNSPESPAFSDVVYIVIEKIDVPAALYTAARRNGDVLCMQCPRGTGDR